MGRAVTAVNEEVILELRKNKGNVTRVTLKSIASARSGLTTHWMDVREWWLKDGAENPWQATRRGCMIHRDQVPALTLAVLERVPPGDFSMSELVMLRRALDRHIDWWKQGGPAQQEAAARLAERTWEDPVLDKSVEDPELEDELPDGPG